MVRSFALAALVVFVFLALNTVTCFKSEEFRKCQQTPFCKDSRARKPGTSGFRASPAEVVDGFVQARLIPENSTGSDNLVLKLIVYQGGVLRIKVDQENVPGGKKRFEVPDVLVDGLEKKRLWLQRITAKDGLSTFYLSSGHEVVLQHEPFQVYVTRGQEKLVSINGKGLFHFEQRREKQEGENWEEHFRSHTDSRPYGPQSIGFDVSFHGAEHVYGIPERATSLALKPTRGTEEHSEPYRLFNLDVFEYLAESPFGLYGSIPFMLSHGSKRTSGFFWLNAAEMLVDVLSPGWDGAAAEESKQGIDTHWFAEAGIVDAFVFVGPGPKDVVQQYTGVTGTTAMPPFFSIGYHQCRWNYKDEADVAQVDAKFDEYDIPYDVIWLDIEHTDGKRYFTWDPITFPTPKEMQAKLEAKGRHMVAIVDPHIKRDEGFALHKEATSKGYYVKNSHGSDYDGWCWPGSSSYPDLVNPEIRAWWAEKFTLKNYVGSTSILHIWNDMNEPSVFNGPEVSMPRDNLHYNGIEHRDVHNAYGYYFHMATTQGLRNREGQRPFVLSRAVFAGTQKIGPIWTGDNTADWEQLRVSVPMILSLGITGIAFTGADVGGFFGNPSSELLTRWYQLGAFYPFFRAHAHLDTKRREPWIPGEPYTSRIREAIHTRYTLLPYYYTLFREAHETGIPVMRPLWFEHPNDPETFAMDDEFLIGDALLVRSVYTEGSNLETVYLPGSEPWFDIKTGQSFNGGKTYKLAVSQDSIPAFQRGGTIIPRKDRFRRSSSQMVDDPYTLVIALNSTQEAQGELYIDDGKSYEFEKGAFIHRRFSFSGGKLSSSSASPASKSYKTLSTVERIIILGLDAKKVPAAHRALVEEGGQDRQADIEAAPPVLRAKLKSNAVAVRLPNVSIDKDWSIKVL
ncbi:hypothetical protein SELMODRAFT_169507 [Selaginella moellendorffii]|uniref:Glucosidase II subunit alpha n=1 Tax=Selaginella moellendorffii TaxID=88036 RepID=D8R936_SELML|nr:probable glucan 1,3-alpha-glucosidase [Selaginella moellendorffii]XP_024528207.1 probable glucan 1,3-alpha-glucosidase [Selaginella moellendorffii]EFJ31082.1 hypothetical protein SELMODRAFT_169507 [Selaginella moellendorffii]|eukprot:XP_002967735.1 probable glucan 1,3-alpha-glucosidase [Selaginella moellendorffii]